ncbi:Lrp/AsnC ligand binding domain-containing protein [Candidatus Bathyarchaeota archaeon]|nr:Lrp/AsnC ligand binding domain-containing protein [Candidatus Bathyarchaeota archaeon]
MVLVRACILIKASPVRFNELLEAIRAMKDVRKVYVTYGRFDIVAFVEGVGNDDVARISANINQLEGVRSTETLIEA